MLSSETRCSAGGGSSVAPSIRHADIDAATGRGEPWPDGRAADPPPQAIVSTAASTITHPMNATQRKNHTPHADCGHLVTVERSAKYQSGIVRPRGHPGRSSG